MKKTLPILLFSLILLVGSVFAVPLYGVEATTGESGGFIIIGFRDKTFFDFDWQLEAIIQPYVNAGQTIQFKGEIAKVSDFTGFTIGNPDTMVFTIYNFDSSKPFFVGEEYNTYDIPIPSSVQQSLSNPLTSIILFDATMTAPTVTGKYTYVAKYYVGDYWEPTLRTDYDTFTVLQSDVPEVCPLPSVDTTYQDIEGGKLKIVTQTEYAGSDCTKSVKRTYNAICNDGYQPTGSGSSTKCEKIPEQLPPVEPTTGCKANEVCCEYDYYDLSKPIGQQKSEVIQCALAGECTFWSTKYPTGKAVDSSKCGGGGDTTIQICGDGTVQSPETCDDGNIISGDGCSNICKSEEGIKGIFETLLEDKTQTELEDSKCKRDEECEKGAECRPFDKLPTIVRERLSKGLFNIAEEGICVIPSGEKPEFDIEKVGCSVGGYLGIKNNTCTWGWTILIISIIIGIMFLKELSK